MTVSDQGMSKKPTARKKRRVLAPSQKYEMWVALLSGQATHDGGHASLLVGGHVVSLSADS